MDDLKNVIKDIVDVYEKAKKYAEGKSSEKALTSRIESLKNLLAVETTRESLDKYLMEIADAAKQLPANSDAMKEIKQPSALFVEFEMRLNTLFRFKRRDLDALIHVTQSVQTSDEVRKYSPPRSSVELITQLEKQVSYLQNEVKKAKDLSRKKKKENKKNALGRLFLGTFGTAIALGDVALALPSMGLASPVAIASMGMGTLSVGAASFNSPGLLNNVPKIAGKSKATKGKKRR